jgi:predicted nucleic acid-binding protein
LIVYADTSALAKLVLDEPGSGAMEEMSAHAERTASVALAYVELRAAMAAALRAGRILPESRDLIHLDLERVWSGVSPIAVDDLLLRAAGDITERFHLRAYDAVHLAALQEMHPSAGVVFACWDRGLRDAARSLGYSLFPEAL